MFALRISGPTYCHITDAIIGSYSKLLNDGKYDYVYETFDLAYKMAERMNVGDDSMEVIHLATGKRVWDLVPYAPSTEGMSDKVCCLPSQFCGECIPF